MNSKNSREMWLCAYAVFVMREVSSGEAQRTSPNLAGVGLGVVFGERLRVVLASDAKISSSRSI